MLKIEVTGDKELIARLTAIPSKVHDRLLQKVESLRLQLEAKIKSKLNGEVLNVRTGALRASINSETEDEPTSVKGRAFSSGDVKYAGIHEFGGTTPAHDIFPNKAKALAFMIGGRQVFAKVVHHPGSKMPERSFMWSSLADMKGQILEGLTAAVREGVRE